MDLGLGGKVVLVTGGSDGLGRALCTELVAEGARVALCARDETRLGATANLLREAGGDVLGVVADVTRPEHLVRFVEEAVARWGRIDGLVNNAGRAAAKRVADTEDADWDDDLQLKLYSAIRLTRLSLPHLRPHGGAIVNTLAIAAKAPGGSSTPTSVSRAAGMALTKALSRDLGPDGIRVNAVLIGLVESGQWERVADRAGQSVDALYERRGRDSGIPLGRIGRAEEFADLVTYLLSPRASYVTGTAINLDGGLCATV
jgi:NAD(P)-dependent dehydrogenase (short-subunit alcohol dehydrogenase family)